MNPLHDRIAIVTGASSGIGVATATALAQQQVHVVLAARRSERIEPLAAQLALVHGVRTLAVATDVSRRADIDALVAHTLETFGRIDILINNAGVGLQGDVADLPEAELRYLFDVNLFGAVNAMQAVIPAMRRQRSGTVVNVTSILGKVALPSLGMVGSSAGYTASKFALEAFSAAARMELAGDGIRVITVAPGVTDSEFNASYLLSQSGVARPAVRAGSLMGVVPAEKVAQRIVKAIARGERDVYVSCKDRLFVWGAHALPGLFEWAMRRLRRMRAE
jgi:short-subunit dehydrogenase